MTLDQGRTARMAGWSVVENAGMALVGFGSLVIYSRFLSPADFGVFSVVLAFVELLSVCVTMLFHDALVQRPDVTEAHFDTAFTFTLGLSLLLAGACAVLAPLFASVVGNPAATNVLRWTALCLPCSAISATIVPLQRRRMQFRTLAVRSVAGRLCGAVLGVTLAVLGARFWGLVAQNVLIALTGSVFLWVASTEHPRLRFDYRAFRSMVGFGLYSVGGMFFNFALNRVFTIVIGITLGTQAAGYLNLSFRSVDVLFSLAAAAVAQTALPTLAKLQFDGPRLTRAYRAALELTSMAIYPCFVGMAVTAPEIVELLFGKKWAVSSIYMTVFALLTLLRLFKNLARPLLSAVGRPQDPLLATAAEMCVMVALIAATGAKSAGCVLAIWAIREAVGVPVTAVVLRRVMNIAYVEQFRGMAPALAGSVAIVIVTCALRRLLPAGGSPVTRLAGLVPAGAMAFVLSAYLVDRTSVDRVLEFVGSAVARPRSQPGQS
jgi:O-antigen/teichoic acid export membrane protein